MKHIGKIYKRSEKAEKPKISYKGEGSISFNQIFIYLLELRTLRSGYESANKILFDESCDSYRGLLFNARE